MENIKIRLLKESIQEWKRCHELLLKHYGKRKCLQATEIILFENSKYLFQHTAKDCPLCWNYMRGNCKDCPIYLKTKQDSCRRTPYHPFIDINKKTKRINNDLIRSHLKMIVWMELLLKELMGQITEVNDEKNIK